MQKTILSGNEAFARAAYEAGVTVASAYPGTPSTEILENITQYDRIDASWAPNEKVALEVGIGASIGGARTIVTMKHVGVNVAADPLFTFSYTGVRGGLVLVVADDPEMHSSQDEQDSRQYARFAKVPMFEPADSQEALDFTRLAFDVSERFDTPVLVRSKQRQVVTIALQGIAAEPALRPDGVQKCLDQCLFGHRPGPFLHRPLITAPGARARGRGRRSGKKSHASRSRL